MGISRRTTLSTARRALRAGARHGALQGLWRVPARGRTRRERAAAAAWASRARAVPVWSRGWAAGLPAEAGGAVRQPERRAPQAAEQAGPPWSAPAGLAETQAATVPAQPAVAPPVQDASWACASLSFASWAFRPPPGRENRAKPRHSIWQSPASRNRTRQSPVPQHRPARCGCVNPSAPGRRTPPSSFARQCVVVGNPRRRAVKPASAAMAPLLTLPS